MKKNIKKLKKIILKNKMYLIGIIIGILILFLLLFFMSRDDIDGIYNTLDNTLQSMKNDGYIVKYIVYDENTDLNGILGDANQYIGKADWFFEDYEEKSKNNNWSGTIEYYRNKKDAEIRQWYFDSKYKKCLEYFTEEEYGELVSTVCEDKDYDFVYGNYYVRLNSNYSEETFLDVENKLKNELVLIKNEYNIPDEKKILQVMEKRENQLNTTFEIAESNYINELDKLAEEFENVLKSLENIEEESEKILIDNEYNEMIKIKYFSKYIEEWQLLYEQGTNKYYEKIADKVVLKISGIKETLKGTLKDSSIENEINELVEMVEKLESSNYDSESIKKYKDELIQIRNDINSRKHSKYLYLSSEIRFGMSTNELQDVRGNNYEIRKQDKTFYFTYSPDYYDSYRDYIRKYVYWFEEYNLRGFWIDCYNNYDNYLMFKELLSKKYGSPYEEYKWEDTIYKNIKDKWSEAYNDHDFSVNAIWYKDGYNITMSWNSEGATIFYRKK